MLFVYLNVLYFEGRQKADPYTKTMNFLAHIYLSGENEPLKVGNFIGDFVKGKMVQEFDKAIQNGVKLHREIDTYTDSHEVVLESKKRLREKYRHYAPVIIDIFYDHFLALDWKKYHPQSLGSYTSDFYEVISKYKNTIPERVNHMLVYMKRDNWLFNYQFFEGISRVFHGMSRRTKFDSKMELAVDDLQQDYESYHQEFNEFFPQLQKHVNDFIEELDHD